MGINMADASTIAFNSLITALINSGSLKREALIKMHLELKASTGIDRNEENIDKITELNMMADHIYTYLHPYSMRKTPL